MLNIYISYFFFINFNSIYNSDFMNLNIAYIIIPISLFNALQKLY